MNANIAKLYQIAGKPDRTIIGLMSGTSFDGLDIAVCNFSGSGLQTKVSVSHFTTMGYNAVFKEALKSVFAKREADLQQITLLNEWIGTYHADLILKCLGKWGISSTDIDLIASHGQTIFHAPKRQHRIDHYPNGTLQIGDGDHIAVKTGIITLSDFRQKNIAAGGEGAPLAVYGDHLLFSYDSENRVMLNIGGIANFTFLPADHSTGFFSTDVGPGNTLMDQFIQLKVPGKYYDEDAGMASAGKVNDALLGTLLDHPFFKADLPKTTGPELFSLTYLQNAMETAGQQDISDEDVMATLAAFSARGIIDAIEKSLPGGQPFRIYLSGGGMYNPVLVKHIEDHFNIKLGTTADLGIHPDAKEAVLFAVLANETVAGGETNFGDHPGVPSVSMGKVSFPK